MGSGFINGLRYKEHGTWLALLYLEVGKREQLGYGNLVTRDPLSKKGI